MKKKYFAHKTAIIDKGARIGAGTKIWHFSHIAADARIGKNCKIGQNVYIAPRVIVGDNVKIQNNVSLYEGVVLEDNVFCGPSCVFTNIINPRCLYPRNDRNFYKITTVRNGASIGANATVVCGTSIGEHAFVGAGAVLTKDVPGHGLVYGAPARLKGWMCVCGEKLVFKNGKASCLVCNRKFKLKGEEVEEI
ncbi:MAG: acyltransferase [Candidatus Omnitrophica bacterium]|nr:acyltransferase [Candidatus Omnitrophota bacterium]MDD5436997.1 acyltransferase [Candidatus Omnitrophota bacterium]